MTKLTIYQNFDDLQRAAIALQASGYFQDVKSKAQAIAKVMAGQELGIPPFASMSGIHIIQNKPVLGANVIATLVKNDPRYDYRIVQADDKACILEWFEDGTSVGKAGFTIQEAQAAGLTIKDNWKNYTSDMLFARAISRGARRFAPGIFGGAPVYTPDEMNVEVDEEGFIDVEAVEITAPTVEDALDDASPEALPVMTIEDAYKVTNSEGEFYSQLNNEKLSAMTIGINKALKKNDLDDADRDTYNMKLAAIKAILQARESGEIS